MGHSTRPRLVWILAGILTFVGFLTLALGLVNRVRQGRGIDHYTAMSGYEWSPVPVLVLMVVAFTVLTVGGILRWYFDRREERDFVATLRRRIRDRARHQPRL
jgi:hypothetical protein